MASSRVRFAVLALIPWSIAAEPAAIEPKTIDEIRAALAETVASMPAVAVEYTAKDEFDATAVAHAESFGLSVPTDSTPEEYRWRVAGEQFYLRVDERRPGVPPYVYVDGFGVAFRISDVDGARPGFSPPSFSESARENYARVMKPDVLLGASVPIAKPTLAEALASPAAEAIGVEDVGGVLCHRVDVRGVEAEESPLPLWLTVWFDPSRDMLPRRIRTVYDPIAIDRYVAEKGATPKSAERIRGAKFDWEVEEYQRLPNSVADEGESWFPKRAVYRQIGGRHVLDVTRAEIRKEPSEDWFEVVPASRP